MKMILWFTHDVFLASRIRMPLNLSCDVVTAQNGSLDTNQIKVDDRVETRCFCFLAGASKEVHRFAAGGPRSRSLNLKSDECHSNGR